jgi:threonine synthase
MGLTLGEGGTPLVGADRMSERLGCDLHLKCEGLNPTGSFKDRGMAVAVGRAAERGARAVVCASTGNTAASAAAYAAHAGLEAIVLVPAGATASAKLAQTRAAGARLVQVRGTFDQALQLGRELGERDGIVLVNSLNPDRIEGQKSVVTEILDQLGAQPNAIALPFGGGGNVTAVAAGLVDAGATTKIVVGEAVERASTFASAIRISEPAHAAHVAELVDEGRVEIVSLTEEELRAAWSRVAREEGVFCEPASAAGVAALEKRGVGDARTVVCILTGHGLKDAAAVDDDASEAVEPTIEAVLEALA